MTAGGGGGEAAAGDGAGPAAETEAEADGSGGADTTGSTLAGAGSVLSSLLLFGWSLVVSLVFVSFVLFCCIVIR